jgi:putative endopeptidase
MKTTKLNLALLSVLFLSLFACKEDTSTKISGIDIEKMDTSISPKNDFFKYVNGTWLKNTKIPDDETSWGSFNELREKTDNDMLAILSDAIEKEKAAPLKDAKKELNATSQQKAVYLYQSYLDLKKRNEDGIKPMQPYFEKVNQIKSVSDLQNYISEMQPIGGGGFYGIFIGSHPKNSNLNTAFLHPSGLGLQRSYYVDQDDDTKDKRQKYVAHISRMFQFFGDDKATADKNASNILTFETDLATPRMSKEDRRDARKRYNPMSISDISKLTPSINWNDYLKNIGVKNVDTLIVTDPNYFKSLENTFSSAKVDDWKNYLRWTLIDRSASMLSEKLDKANWEFYSKTMRGAKQQKPLNERALNITNGAVGEALGQLYVDKKFPPEAKAKAEAMIKNIIKAFANRIKNLAWMSEDTKTKALEKLGKMTVKIAYPDEWKDYSALQINKSNSYVQNRLAYAKWRFDENIDKIGKPVDKSEWHMPPQMVNAYFNPPNNEIVFPAAILQPPFYNYQADDAVNYGGIGAVIGHEISHSFDDSGSRYDGDGNLVDWWTKGDLEKFTVLGKKLEDQFSAIEALPETHLNGKYTLGENIGDLGGVNVAYDALQLNFKANGRPNDIDGFTAEQRFFMSWATVWRTKMRDDALKNLIKTNPHSPGKYRAYMPLKNIEAFYMAFNIKEGDEMYIKPEDRVLIW